MAARASLRKSSATNLFPPRLPPPENCSGIESRRAGAVKRTSTTARPRLWLLSASTITPRHSGSASDSRRAHEERMYHYDAKTALEELQEDALLPHPVKLRDMILRIQLGPQEAQAMNQEFQDYLTRFGEIQRVARGILEKLAAGKAKS